MHGNIDNMVHIVFRFPSSFFYSRKHLYLIAKGANIVRGRGRKEEKCAIFFNIFAKIVAFNNVDSFNVNSRMNPLTVRSHLRRWQRTHFLVNGDIDPKLKEIRSCTPTQIDHFDY